MNMARAETRRVSTSTRSCLCSGMCGCTQATRPKPDLPRKATTGGFAAPLSQGKQYRQRVRASPRPATLLTWLLN